MELLKTSTDWAKAEVFSTSFFILFGIVFLLASIGFWQLGKTVAAKAFITPMLVAGILLLTIGIGIGIANKARITSFAEAYNNDANAFVKSEIVRTQKSMNEYQTIVFKVIPFIIVVAALLIVFIDKPLWRAISITTIAMMVIILLVDNNANTRIEDYHEKLLLVEGELNN